MNNYINYLPPASVSHNDLLHKLYPDQVTDKKNVKQVTFQVTEDCCMACTYCYQHNKTNTKMTFETAKSFIDKLLNDEYENINTSNTFAVIFEFIGGEPLMEIQLIQEICEYILNEQIRLNHPWTLYTKFNICSNGLLYETPKVQEFFQKYGKFCSFTISIDGNKMLHDACRLDLQGNGTYDRAMSAVHKYQKQFGEVPTTKMTIAPNNVNYVYDAVVNLINEGYIFITFNCVFENVWNLEYAKIYYDQLKKVANYLIDNNLYNKVNIRLFEETFYSPMEERENSNWCGGTTSNNIAIDSDGLFYPCIRYMKSSLNGRQKPILVGDIENGFNGTDEYIANNKMLDSITRRSQSTDKCFYCPIAMGCAWCSAYNYEEFGTPNKRATYICDMHKAISMANVYYWNKLYKYLGIDKTFEMHIPKEWALEIIDENEYNYLLTLSKGV